MEQPQQKKPQKDAVFLMAAARYGNLNKLRDLIEKQHYDVDMAGDEAFTALHVAVVAKKANIVEYLVKAGANIFEKNAEGASPFDLAEAEEKKNHGSEVFSAMHGGMLNRGECKICFDSEGSLYTLPCGDSACVQCIRNWFHSLLDDNDHLKCPSAECQEMMPEDQVPPDDIDAWRLLSREQYARHDRQALQRHLAVTRDFQFCTTCPSGGFIVPKCKEVKCAECDAAWCRDCRLQPHSAHSCEEFRKLHATDAQVNLQCMSDNCKKCPACRAQIERDGGCSHMKCFRCRYEFCWWCLQKYVPGQYTFDENGDCPCPKDGTVEDLNRSGGWA